MAEENIEKGKSTRKKRKNTEDKCLPLKKRGRLGRAKIIHIPEIDEIKIEPDSSQSQMIEKSTEVSNVIELPLSVEQVDEPREEMTDEELVTYLVTYRLQEAVLWAERL